MARTLPPSYAHTADWLNRNAGRFKRFAGFDPDGHIRWTVTDAPLRALLNQPPLKRKFHALVQFRVRRADEISFRTLTLSRILKMHGDRSGAGQTSVIDAIVARTGRAPTPDDDELLGRVVSVEAIYHSSFIALPFQWRCENAQVFDSDDQFEAILRSARVGDSLRGRVQFAAGTFSSSRVAYLADPLRALWRVGKLSFAVEAYKREELRGDGHPWRADEIERHAEGWRENAEPYDFERHSGMGHLNFNPERTALRSDPDASDPKEVADHHEELRRRGILPT